MYRVALLFSVLLVSGCGTGAHSPQTNEARQASTAGYPLRIDATHLPNAIRVHERVISGGLPAGDAAFAELRALGVTTIISVDGARPDVDAAKRHRLRYVHLPHGYDGVGQDRARDLAKAIHEFEGPVYIHCHHGKHRSPAAASVACVGAGLISRDQRMAVLRVAGTSPNYRGLFESAREAKRFEAKLLEELQVEFPEIATVPPLAEAMVAIERTHDQLRQIAAAGWRTPADHPDLDPPHEALMLREHFTELLRTDQMQEQPAEYVELVHDSEQAARELEDSLREWLTSQSSGAPPGDIATAADRISANCVTCHQTYRDVPLGEK